jgi:hypothetical protein
MQFDSLIGQTLRSFGARLSSIHAAWVDAKTPELVTDHVELNLTSGKTSEVQPCEVPIAGRYPALGITLCNGSRTSSGTTLKQTEAFLPAQVADVRLWDYLGEGPVSAADIVLAGGTTFTIRHIYPPTTLGIDIWPEGQHEL